MSETKKIDTIREVVGQAPDVRHRLVEQLRGQLLAWLGAGIRSTAEEAESVMLGAMEKAADNEARAAYLESVILFRKYKPLLVEDFLEAWETRFTAYFSGNAAGDVLGQTAAAKPVPAAATGLSLMKKEDQEESLLISMMVDRMDKQFGLEQIVLRRRLASLVGTGCGDEEVTPLCPAALAMELQQTLQKGALTTELRRTLYVQFDYQVMRALEQVYVRLGGFFQEHGVLPELSVEQVLAEMAALQREQQETNKSAERQQKQGARESGTGRSGTGTDSSVGHAAGTGRAGAAEQQERTAFQQHIEQQINEINSLLGNYRNTLGVVLPTGSRMLDSFAPPEASKSYSCDQVVRALQSMQRQRATGSVFEGENTDSFKQSMYQALASTTASPKEFRISGEHSNLIDLVGMLFDFVKEERRLKNDHKNALIHLQNLYCQVALHDASFFYNTKHPAHLLLNRMVQAGSEYQGESEQRVLDETIEETVRQALVEYQHDDQVFERLLGEFNKKVEVLQQRVEKRERRAVDAVKGREKLIFARKHARGFIEGCIKRHQPPEIIRAFLQAAWTDVMVFYFLRTGPSSVQWQEKARMAEQLARSCTPLSEQEREQFAARNEALMSGLREALKQLGSYSDTEIGKVISDVRTCQKAVQEKQHEIVRGLTNTLASSMSAADERELLVPDEIDEKNLDEDSRQLMARLRQVRFGTWFEFTEPPHRLKLAWFSPTTQRGMFVDSAGQGSYIKEWNTLFAMLQAGEAKIVEAAESAPFFERALQAVQRTLKQFVRHYVSEIRESGPLGA